MAGRDLTINFGEASIDDRTRRVFVVHGRNEAARSSMFAFLRSIHLDPIEWSEAEKMTGEGSPYIGKILDTAFNNAQAIVVLLTPDDIAYLRTEYERDDDDERETQPQGQARPNVLFEAGMAIGRDAKRTVLVELGQLRPFSDVVGRLAVRINNSVARRKSLAQRLESVGCSIDLVGNDWLNAGDFTPPPPLGGELSFEPRVPSPGRPSGGRMTARFRYRRGGGSYLEITNVGSEAIRDLNVEVPDGLQGFQILDTSLPIPSLPVNKSVTLICSLTQPRSHRFFYLTLIGTTEADIPVREEVLVDLEP